MSSYKIYKLKSVSPNEIGGVPDTTPTAIEFVGGGAQDIPYAIAFDEGTVNPLATFIPFDPNPNATFTYSIPTPNQNDYLLFSIVNGNQLQLNITPDYDNPQDDTPNNIYALNVRVTNDFGNFYDQFMLFIVEEVTIIIDVVGVSVTPTTTNIEVNNTEQLSVAFTPSNATDKSGVWESNNANTTVNSSGLATGITEGSSIITFTSNDGSFTDTCGVTVIAESVKPVVSVSLPTTASISVGNTQTLVPIFNPTDATEQGGSWVSSVPANATVSSTGVVTAITEGSSVITFTATDTTNGASDTTTVTVTAEVAQTLKAFPAAYGAGAYATGGRGGLVVHVTTLADSGVGSLRWAITDASFRLVDRTIVFDVSGVIELTTNLYPSNPDDSDISLYTGGITINGFTAPEGGITIIGAMVRAKWMPSTIIRGVRFKGGYNAVDGNNSYAKSSILWGSYDNMILDHISSGLADEQAFGASAGRGEVGMGATVQNSLMGRTDRIGIVGSAITSNDSARHFHKNISFLRNVMADCQWRTPNVAGNTRVDLVNNYVFNWIKRLTSFTATDYGDGATTQQTLSNLIGNVYMGGANTSKSGDTGLNALFQINDNNSGPQFYMIDNPIQTVPTLQGNLFYDVIRGKALGYDVNDPTTFHNAFSNYSDGSNQYIDPLWFQYSQFPILGEAIPVLSSSVLKAEIFPTAGACYYTDDNGVVQFYRDDIDIEITTRALNDDDTVRDGGISTYKPIAESFKVGGSREIPHNTRPGNFYQSNPHIPEAWLITKGLTGTPTIHNDISDDGIYTWMERYINQVDN